MALSRMYHMRRLNNCIKDALLGGAVRLGAGTRKWGQLTNNPAALLPPPQQHPSSGAGSSASAAAASGGLRVLDLACGKAGDLQKWNKAAKCVPGGLQRYVGVDIARGSLDDAVNDCMIRFRLHVATGFERMQYVARVLLVYTVMMIENG